MIRSGEDLVLEKCLATQHKGHQARMQSTAAFLVDNRFIFLPLKDQPCELSIVGSPNADL